MNPESFLVIGGGTLTGQSVVRLLVERGETLVATFDAVELPPDDELSNPHIVKSFVGDVVQGDDLQKAMEDVSNLRFAIAMNSAGAVLSVRSDLHHLHRYGANGNNEILWPCHFRTIKI